MATIANEELDKARAMEAYRIDPTNHMVVAINAARLAREGWAPNPVHEAMKKAGYSVAERSSHGGRAWDWSRPGKGAMDSRQLPSPELAWAEAEKDFEQEIARARELMTAGLL